MIDLGKSKEVTAVLKLLTLFSQKKDFFRIFNTAFRVAGINTYKLYIWDAMCQFLLGQLSGDIVCLVMYVYC